MNFLYLFISTFLLNYFLMWIISLLPIKNKRIVSSVIITLMNVGTFIYYTYYFFLYIGHNLILAVNELGSALAILIAFVATMVMLLDGIKIIKTKRQRAFLNAYRSNKATIPFIVIIIIFYLLGLIALGFAIYIMVIYDSKLLIALIGALLAFLIFICLATYLLISNRHSKNSFNKGDNLLFILDINDKRYLYEAPIITSIDDLLGELANIYILTEYGSLITKDKIYLVRGITIRNEFEFDLKKTKLLPLEDSKLTELSYHFLKYQTLIIKIDENYNILKTIKK